MTRDPQRILRKMATWALLAPFLLLSLLADGVMPASPDGGTVLVICTGDGPLEMVVNPVTGEHAPKQTAQEKCAWAAAHGPAVHQGDWCPPSHALGTARTTLPACPVVIAAGRATGLPPATGPPTVL